MRNFFIKVSSRLAILIGKIHAPFTRKRINGKHYFELAPRLLPGHVFLTRTSGELTNLFIPGPWKHAAIYAGNGRVVEALGGGVVARDIISFLLSKDFVAVLEPTFHDAIEDAAIEAERFVGRPYDYEFRSDNDALYCSELIFAAYNRAMNGACPFVPRERFGQLTIIPDDLAKAADKWKWVWKSV